MIETNLKRKNSSIKKRQKRSHQSGKPKKPVVKEFYSMKNRCSRESLLSIILGLRKEQKECVRSMGFGALLKMKITDIPLKLGFYVLQKFDYERMVIDIEGKELKVTTESIHDMLGIPIGYGEWKQQFKKDSIIRLSAIKNVIVSTTQADLNFQLNFVVLFLNTFCESASMGICNLFRLSYISRKIDISNIDWCSYVLDCLVRTKNSYIPYSDTDFFVRPSAFLVLFYADNIRSEALMVTRKRPTICYWSSEKIKYRETFEQEKGRFGLGELNEEFVNKQDEGETDLKDSDSDKDEDHSVVRIKEKLNSKLNDMTTKFREKESFRIFKENMTNTIVEEKAESTTLFEFPGNETGVEGINFTPIIGQKTNDKKGNEDEEENHNDGNQSEVDYLLDSNETENEGIKNDGDKNQKESETEVKENDGKNNENDNDEEKKDDYVEETNNHEETIQQTENVNLLDKVPRILLIMSLELDFQKRKNQKVYIDKEKKLKKEREIIQARKTLNMEIKGGVEAKNTTDASEDKQTKIEKDNAEDRDTHPSFSLGLSEDSDQTFSKKSNESSPKKPLTKKQINDDHQKNAYLTSTLSDERMYEKFKENFHDNTDWYKKILNIKDIDMCDATEQFVLKMKEFEVQVLDGLLNFSLPENVLKNEFILSDLDVVFIKPHIGISLKYIGIHESRIVNMYLNHLVSSRLNSFISKPHCTSKTSESRIKRYNITQNIMSKTSS
uniref:Uncharacterized protein n=1 Tax=Lactuca sativa TaxID=4236 RepID=A0A9R1VJF6_LACSA|nr:hypothetical protein LSAT_V11C500239110 [Lactuca sativa]